MRQAHAVADVRSAEQALMAVVPEGTLMQRAAAGLAATCARLLGQVHGAQGLVLAGTGHNGAAAIHAPPRPARRAARSPAPPPTPPTPPLAPPPTTSATA